MHNNYKIIRTIYENVFQRILECKDDATGEIFYSNIITSEKIINLINISELKNLKSNILDCYSTEDRIYIFTKSLEGDCKKLTDLTESLTLKDQFTLAEKSIKLANNVYSMTDVVQQKILDLDRLYVDEENNLLVDCNLIFEQEYDIADNESFKRLGNILHVIFSGQEIIDYNISDTIPPDVLKIIVRCLTNEYVFPNDALVELHKSPIYKMILGKDSLKDNKEEIKEEIKEEDPSLVIHDQEGNDTFNIYLEEDLDDENTNSNKKAGLSGISMEIKRAIVSLLIVVLVLLIGNTIIKAINSGNEAEATNSDSKPPLGETPSSTEDPPTEELPAPESTDVHFNEDFLSEISYEGERAQRDTDIYVEGNSSLLIENQGEGKIKSLFAAVDFTDENFSYMLMRQIGVSAKIKALEDTEAQIVFEAYKDGVNKSNFHTAVDVYDDIWSQFTVPINVTDADLLFIYLEYEGENKVWIDALSIDAIK